MLVSHGTKAEHLPAFLAGTCAHSVQNKWSPNTVVATALSNEPAAACSLNKSRVLLQGFFATEVEGHQDFDGNPAAAVAEIVDADHFAERLAVERAGTV